MNKSVLRKVASLIALGAALPIVPAHAVVLEQKWQAGQNLAYQTEINGTASIQAPADANFLLAGVPLEVEITGNGLAEIQTLKVDEAGVGTIAVRIPKFDLNAQAMGQKGHLSLLETTSKISLNGKAIKIGDGTNPLAKPAVAARISREGKLLGIESLLPPAAKPATDPAAAQKPVDAAQAIDRAALMVATITRALPTLWPGRDIQKGEAWKINLSWPIEGATPAQGDAQKVEPTQFGEWNLTLLGEETIGGRTLQRVGLEGTLAVDSAQFKTAATADAAPQVVAPEPQPNANGGPQARLRGQSMTAKTKQEIKGDVWFDAAAGQIVRADMVLGARVNAGVGTKETSQGWADFTGSLLLNLQNAA